MRHSAISVTGLRKAFGSQVVLDGIDLHVPPGTIFALLGPSGVGKTTMLQILSAQLRPDSGEVRVLGHDVATEADAVRSAVGVVGQCTVGDGRPDARVGACISAAPATVGTVSNGTMPTVTRAAEAMLTDPQSTDPRWAAPQSANPKPIAPISADPLKASLMLVDPMLTGEQNLTRAAALHNMGVIAARHRVADLLEGFDLREVAQNPAFTYSEGTRLRLDLAMALAGNPHVLFLDEPTAGLVPRSRHQVWEIIKRLAANGVTVFLTTQHLDEAGHLADHIAVLDRGTVTAEGTPDELKRLAPAGHVRMSFTDPGQFEMAARTLPTLMRDDNAFVLHVPTTGDQRSLKALLDQLDEALIDVDRLTVHTPDPDDVLLALTGRPHAFAR
ncbi:ABC transporter ATP-binding protein [Sinosporangium siamense]|nr:ATP-binding cassette domain-containing protein [Sinosporangium siamense]